MKPNWTKEELKTYVLIYCANADFSESDVELNHIKSKIENGNFDKIHAEFKTDNDYQSIDKIHNSLEDLNFSNEEKKGLLEETKALFMSDEKFDILERNMFKGLSRILKIQ